MKWPLIFATGSGLWVYGLASQDTLKHTVAYILISLLFITVGGLILKRKEN